MGGGHPREAGAGARRGGSVPVGAAVRVPRAQSLRDGDERAYMPQVVSIGPLHRGRRRLREMERHKWRALHHVLKRTGHDVTAYLDALRPMEERARACYDGRVAGMQGNELVECLVLDGTFVLELFRGAQDGGKGFGDDLGYSRHDPIFAMRGAMHAIRNDMILLENQIPLFVLDLLLGLQLGNPEQTGAVAGLAVRFFDPLMPTDEPLLRKDRSKLESSIGASPAAAAFEFDPLSGPMLHCLDVFRRSLLRAGLQPTRRPPRGCGSRSGRGSGAWRTSGGSSSSTACRSSGRPASGAGGGTRTASGTSGSTTACSRSRASSSTTAPSPSSST